MIRVTVWNENLSETKYEDVAALFPKGIHGYLAVLFGKEADLDVRTATMDQPENGLPDEVLENTDVLIWWAHTGHHLVSDGVAWKVQQRVLRGMGLIVLHSAHLSKPFQLLMGTSCTLKWRDGDFERLWTVLPNHPIAQGVGEFIELEEEEMYGERLTSRNRMSWFSSAGSRAGRCSVRAAAGIAGLAGSSISNPGMSPTPPISRLRSSGFS